MVGLNQDRASPHVAILCKEKWFRTQARQVILESGLLQDRGWVGCIRLPFEIRQNGATSPAPKSTFGLPASQEPTIFKRDQHNVAISYDPESTSGLRIAISGFNGYVRMATLGGIIEINGALFGLTVSHVFSAQTPSYDEASSEHESDTELFALDGDDLDPFVRTRESDKVPEVAKTYSRILEASGTSDKFTQASEIENIGLSPDVEDDTVDPFMGRHLDRETPKWYVRTNPSQSRKPCFVKTTSPEIPQGLYFVTGTVKPIPHTAVLTLGYLRRSLGSRETFGNKAAYDFEWAVISQDGDHGPIKYDTMINLVTTNSDEKLLIGSVANSMVPAGTHLLLRAPRGGITATAIGSESSVQLNSSSRYLCLWTVRVDCSEVGDCGSWIVNQATGELLGMLVASCEAVCEAYILPIKEIFKEIEISSGHPAKLPALGLITEKKETKTASMEDFEVNTDTTSDPATDLNLLYWPLQAESIRILKVLPGKHRADVHCELSICSLGDPADYESLCYALGSSEPTSRIYLNGQSIWVSSNLASALDNLRYIDRPRNLWVDDLCINPENVEERNSQVSLLTPILLQARGVCIWLGVGNSESDWAFSSYSSIFGSKRKAPKKFLHLANILCDLFWRAWFCQGVVQAICLARHATVHCGRASMSWKDSADILSVLYSDPPVNFPSYQHDLVSMSLWLVNNIENSIRWLDDGQIERRYSLDYLVMLFSWLETTSAHDSIYSLLSLASDVYPLPKSSVTSSAKDFPHQPLPLKEVDEPNNTPVVPQTAELFPIPLERQQRRPMIVDYSQGFEHVCKDFVQLAIQNSQSLDILCIPWARSFDRLPSWVPDRSQAATLVKKESKSQRVNGSYFASHRRGPGILQIYDASGLKPPIVLISNSSDGAPLLSAQGFTIDAVQAITSLAPMGNIPPDWAKFLGWKDMSEPPPDKAWRTLIGDRGKDTRCFAPAAYRRACGRMFQQMQTGSGLLLSQATQSEDRTIQEFAQTAEAVVWGRRLIRTAKHGFLGLAPEATQEGDIIAILYGLSVPVVLRQIHGTPDGDNVFILIGECFIYGMMDGEALRFKEVHGIQDQTFVLR